MEVYRYMLIRFLKWIGGYLLVQIKGYSPERFLNLCTNRNIKIWDLCKKEEGYEFYISLKDYLTIRPIVRKTKTIPFVQKRFGFPFYFQRYKKRKGFFLGVLLAMGIVYTMSLYIWDISVSGQYTHTEEAIIKYLKSIDVYAGIKKDKLNCQEIEEQIRKKYTDIGWVSAEIRGTRLLLKLTETNMPKPYEEQTEPCHIVADKDGIITSIVTRKGTPLVRIGDTVRKGQILVSGVVEVYGDDQNVVKRDGVVADADITMKTFYDYSNQIMRKHYEKIYTGSSAKYYNITLFGKKIYIVIPFKNYEKYNEFDTLTSDNTLKFNDNFYLPIGYGSTHNYEYETVEREYSKDEVEKLANGYLERYLKKLKECNVEIIENRVEIKVDKSKCCAQGKIIVIEPVYTTRKITEEETYVEPTPEPTIIQ